MTYKLPFEFMNFSLLRIIKRRKLKLPDSGATKRMHPRGGPNGKPEAPTT